jgi:hypothetical protein
MITLICQLKGILKQEFITLSIYSIFCFPFFLRLDIINEFIDPITKRKISKM